MQKYNSSNERIKRRYYAYLKEANGFSEPSIDAVAVALDRFEQSPSFGTFETFLQTLQSPLNATLRSKPTCELGRL